MRENKQLKTFGGIALEYVIISSVALLLSLAGAGYVYKLVNDRMQKISQQTGLDYEQNSFDLGDILQP